MVARKRHPKRTRNLAFRIWRHEGKNLTKTSRILRDEHGIKVDPPTIMKWRDSDLWESKDALLENQVVKLMRSSEDPILRQMAMDDVLLMKFLGTMARLIQDAIGSRVRAKTFMPRNAAELMKMMEFVTTQQERILTRQHAQADTTPDGPKHVTFNDNRKIILQGKLAALPKQERQQVIKEMHGAVDQEALAKVRQEAWAGNDDEAAFG